jgi:hypothetical protein
VYNSLCIKIEKVEISLQFLVIGFSEDANDGHIYLVDGTDAPKCYDEVGVWAIGSGAHAALSSLAFHIERRELYKFGTSPATAAYFACEAKFMAESSGHVGRDAATVIVLSSRDAIGDIKFINVGNIAKIKEIWKTQGAPRTPANIDEQMKAMFQDISSSDPNTNE